MLDTKIKRQKKDGWQNTTHSPAIELEDLKKLKNSDILSLTHPLSLLSHVWFHISLFWGCRGFEGQRSQEHLYSVKMRRARMNEATKNH